MRKETKYIIIHCSATKPSMDIGFEEIDKWHRAKGWFGCGYHKIIRRKKFAGCEVFEVDADRYNRCRRAKLRYERFSKFVCDDDTALAIREKARTNPAKGIMIQDGSTGAMTYLKFPRGKTGVQF